MKLYDSDFIKKDGYYQNRSFFKVHRKLLHLTGILPRSGLLTSPWCHNILSIVTLIWCIPPLIALLYAIYENWGDVTVVTGMVFQVSFVLNCTAIYIYLILNRKPLQRVLCTSEVAFTRCIDNLGLNKTGLYDTVMSDKCRHNIILTRTVLTLNFTAYLFWTIVPFVLWCIESENEFQNTDKSEEIQNYNNEQWKYFCYRMWLPQNATQTPTYQIIYVYQALENSMVILIHTTHSMVTFSVMLHLTSQFKALAICLERIDETSLTLKEIVTSADEVSSNDPRDNTTQNRHEKNRHHVNKGNISKRNTTSFGSTGGCEMLQRKQSDVSKEMGDLEMLQTPKDDDIYRYLVNCVKFHQFLLQHAEDTVRFLSPVLFIDFIVGLSMMCTTVFQVAVGSEDGINFRLIAAAFGVWYPIFLICWFGERLTEQSLSVQEASIRCGWYTRTARFKRILLLLIMRSQKPVKFNAGRFFIVSLETFSDMANKVYAYYTVLKRMHDS